MVKQYALPGIFLSMLLSTPLITGMAHAQSAEDKGLAIAVEADRRDEGWQDSAADMKMVLRNKRGDESVRILRVRGFEMQNDGNKSLTIFDQPADVRGTALLTFAHKVEDDDQWLYLPALKRVKRISSTNKSGPFMGSEFSFEDLAGAEVEKYTYKYLRDEPCGPMTCFVVESYPVDKNSGYTKQVSWIDQQEYRTHKVEFYDRKKSLLKTLDLQLYKQYKGKFWRAHKSLMVNHQTGKSTDLIMANFQFQQGLDEGDFTQNALKRAR